MITRHFYRLDEVEASLLWCIVHRRVEESLFWCLELIDSGLGIYALQLLWKCWIYFVGVGSLAWFQHALTVWKLDEIQENDILLLCFQLAMLPPESRDCSPYCLLILGIQNYEQPANYITLSQKDLSVVQKAILQQKLLLAWQICRVQWNPSEYSSLLLDSTHKNTFTTLLDLQEVLELPDDISFLTRALALCFVSVCLKPKQLHHSMKALHPEISQVSQTKLLEWKELLGRRKRRHYGILLDSLSWITRRGRISFQKSTLKEVREVWKFLDSSVPCWQDKDFQCEDEAYEAIMDETFPDDIPDEWSKEDQQKSHGAGVLQLKELPSFAKFLRKWLRVQSSKLIWKGVKQAIAIAESLVNEPFTDFDPGFQTLYTNKKELHSKLLPNLFQMKAVRRTLVPFHT